MDVVRGLLANIKRGHVENRGAFLYWTLGRGMGQYLVHILAHISINGYAAYNRLKEIRKTSELNNLGVKYPSFTPYLKYPPYPTINIGRFDDICRPSKECHANTKNWFLGAKHKKDFGF